MLKTHVLLTLFASVALAACSSGGDTDSRPDAKPIVRADARLPDAKATTGTPDAAPDIDAPMDIDAPDIDAPIIDAPAGTPDAFRADAVPRPDSAPGTPDAQHFDAVPHPDAAPHPDATVVVPDASTVDAPDVGTPAGQIAVVRRSAPATGLNLTVTGATVTYLKPALGDDLAGFFVQATMDGPAVFVQVDPATLGGGLAIGNVVSFTVTTTASLNSLVEATAITGLNVTSAGSGASVAALVQDITGVNFKDTATTPLVDHESEIVSVSGQLSAFSASGPRHDQAVISTTGTPSSGSGTTLRIRMPDALRDMLDVESGCAVTVPQSPLWRIGNTPQVLVYQASEITVGSCPAPGVASAIATDATHVAVHFDRKIAPASLTAGGFTIAGGITVSAAAIGTDPRTVTLTTSAQTSQTVYNLTVGTSVTDTVGKAVGTGASSKSSFIGFDAPATLVINEVAPGITGDHDLVELRAVTAGNVYGYTLEQDVSSSTVLATLPALEVAAGDIIVVHLTPTGTTATAETNATGKAVSSADNYDTAWDVLGSATGIGYSNRVLTLRSGIDGKYKDVAAFFNSTLSGTPPSGFPYDVTDIIAAGVWVGTCAKPSACTYDEAKATSVDWKGAGNSKTGASVFRSAATDTNSKADWTSPTGTTQTLGAAN